MFSSQNMSELSTICQLLSLVKISDLEYKDYEVYCVRLDRKKLLKNRYLL